MNNWQVAAGYIDLLFSPWGQEYNNDVRAAGIQTAGYIDANNCSGSYAVGPYPYPHPDCAQLTDDAFYSEDGFPDRALTVGYGGLYTQKYGNPASPTLQAAVLAAVQNELTSWGQLDLMQFDDAATPDEYYGSTMCWGVGSFNAGSYSCAAAAGGAAHAPFTSTYSRSQWQAGEAALAAQLPLPVVFNGLASYSPTETQSAVVSVATSLANSWGGECDSCFYSTQANSTNLGTWTGPVLDRQLQNVMDVINSGRKVIVVNEDVLDTGIRTRALADAMLVYDPDHLYVNNQPCGAISHIHACAEQGLTFYAPINGYPVNTSALRSSTGLYVREFAACYDRGTPIGACATVVNPDWNTPHALPSFNGLNFRHTLVLSGAGPCNCYGDAGSVNLTGPAAPATIPAATAYVLLK
jgi:hypothetical protein